MVNKKVLAKGLQDAQDLEEAEGLIPTEKDLEEDDKTFRGYARKLTTILKPAWWVGDPKKKIPQGKKRKKK